MNKKAKEVCMKILYAVETGGQVYGHQRYDAFVEAYTNSPEEHAITIGAGQWYGAQARMLLDRIRQKYRQKFAILDYAGIGEDLDNADWTRYRIAKNSDKARCIIRIISSDVGKLCQDEMMQEQIEANAQKIVDAYGEMEAGAIIECINIIHLGGWGALVRILKKTEKPYTAATIYEALCTDPEDRSNDNQVGDYVSRQKKVFEMINTCLSEREDDGMTEKEIRQKLAEIAKKYKGCNEADGSHRQIINVYNGHKPLARGYKVQYTDAWCATYVSAVGIIGGLTDIMPTECGCGNMIEQYKKIGRWEESDTYVPKLMDIVMYDWDDNGKGDCVGYPEHVGFVLDVNGDTMTIIEGNLNNSVAYRTLKVNGKYIRGYCLPDYASKAGKVISVQEEKKVEYTLKEFIKEVQKATGAVVDGIAGSETISKTVTVSATKNRIHAVVKPIQKRLNYLGFDCGEVDGVAGDLFTEAVKAFQKVHGCVCDGEITAKNKTWKYLLGMM